MPNPEVTLELESGGVIKLELYPELAPNTVNNFLALVSNGFYDDLIFHRVIPGFMIQGGCPDGTGMSDPGYSIRGEFASNGFNNELEHSRGVISMARTGNPNSAGSQFFIMHSDAPHLDGKYAAFGEMTDGYDCLDEIAECATDANDRPKKEQRIKRATAETYGIEYPAPEKI